MVEFTSLISLTNPCLNSLINSSFPLIVIAQPVFKITLTESTALHTGEQLSLIISHSFESTLHCRVLFPSYPAEQFEMDH